MAVCAVVVPWAEVGDVSSWPRGDRFAALGVLMGFAFTVAQIVGPSWWERRTTGERAGAPAVTAALRIAWRDALAERVLVERRGQLDRLASLDHRIEIEALAATGRLPAIDGTSPRITVTGPTVPLSELAARWGYGRQRLVLLGEPGSGKSHTALTLTLGTTERSLVKGGAVAELFLLNRWFTWHLDHPDGALEDWLADEITAAHDIPAMIAAELVALGMVVPVLDGLDEVPETARALCASRIADYSGAATHRPFVLSCRFDDYRALVDWVPTDHAYTIRPLSPAIIAATIRATQPRHGGWDVILSLLDEPGIPLAKVLSAPLRLATALEAYRDTDPTELAGLSLPDARTTLWARFLEPSTPVRFRHHGIDDIHRWLNWLATRMHATDRQTITIHELTYLDPRRTRHLRTYRATLGLAAGLTAGLAGGLFTGLAAGQTGALAAALTTGLTTGLVTRRGSGDQVTVPTKVPLPKRLQAARHALSAILICGSITGLTAASAVVLAAGLTTGLVVGLAAGLTAGLITALTAGLEAGRATYRPEESDVSHAEHPRAVMRASAQSGLVAGLTVGAGAVLIAALAFGSTPVGAVGLAVGLAAGLGAGLATGLVYGFDAVIYRWWLNRSLARSGSLPQQLDTFLEWCSGTRGPRAAEGTTRLDRSWIRQAGGQFQFRHRELQEHLAHIHSRHRTD